MTKRDDGRNANWDQFNATMQDLNRLRAFFGENDEAHSVMAFNLIALTPHNIWVKFCAIAGKAIKNDQPKTVAQYSSALRRAFVVYGNWLDTDACTYEGKARQHSLALAAAMDITPERTLAAFSKATYDDFYP